MRCVQRPHPPVWMASGDHTVNRRAARGGYESAKAIRSMELWSERVVPIVERALGMPIGEMGGERP